MRLLERRGNDDYILTDIFDDASTVPPYAILSHTWGPDLEEVTLQDVVLGNSKEKAGYEKLRFCGEQAWKDNIQYFWIDTCCINKKNKAELSEAIESMFLWYEKSARCYVFLSDVSVTPSQRDCHWGPSFKNSRWFTRGWTLQELLAPKFVEFFSREGYKLGDKLSLTQQVHEITAIPQAALRGTPLHHFSVEARLRWKGQRETKLAEDGAYSMSGLFSVYLAPLYGEGAELAYRRLHEEIRKTEECIRDVRLTDPRDDQRRIEDTKGGLLRNSYRWILDNSSFQQWKDDPTSPLLWIKGDPGKGKTMLLCGIVNELNQSNDRILVSSFFCQATDSRINSGTTVIRGLLYLLLQQQPRLVPHVREKYDTTGNKTLFEDANAWTVLKKMFASLLQDPSLPPTYLIVDALDECTSNMSELIAFIMEQSLASSRTKWLISSRNWPEIEQQLEQTDHKVRLSLELNAASVEAAVNNYILQRVSHLVLSKKYDDATQNAVLEHLTSNANNTFLWVSLVCEILEKTPRRHVLKKLKSFPPGLTSLYERMMQQIWGSDDATICTQILATTTMVYQPLTVQELVGLVEGLEEEDSDTTLELIASCGSLLTVRDSTIYFVHQSVRDFIIEQTARDLFPSGKDGFHYSIAIRSFHLMSRVLHRDMFGFKDPGRHILSMKDPANSPSFNSLKASRYACIYWVDHLRESQLDTAILRATLGFLTKSYLYWLEASSLFKDLPRSMTSVANLHLLIDELTPALVPQSLSDLVRDAYRFSLYNVPAIEQFPLQSYVSALVFSPSESPVRRAFRHEAPDIFSIQPTLKEQWSACLQTLGHYNHAVVCMAVSYDSTLLAAATHESVYISELNSGTHVQTLQHGFVKYMAFSSDRMLLATASQRGLIEVWNVRLGICLNSINPGSGCVTAIAFSHDDLVSASCRELKRDYSLYKEPTDIPIADLWYSEPGPGSIQIWDPTSGESKDSLNIRGIDQYHALAFSSDSKQLASGSNQAIKLFNLETGYCTATIKSDIDIVTSIAFSPNSTLLASASNDGIVKIWKFSTRSKYQFLRNLHNDGNRIVSVVFSPDSEMLALASETGVITLWNSSSWSILQTLTEHTMTVSSVAFSHDSTRLVSSSLDGTVKIWDITSTKVRDGPNKGHDAGLSAMAFSHDSKLLASAAMDRVVKIWRVDDGACLHTINLQATFAKEARDLRWSCDATQLVMALDDGTVQLWAVTDSSVTCLQSFLGGNGYFTALTISNDWTRLAVALSGQGIIKIWDLRQGLCLYRRTCGRRVEDLSFSPDGSRLHTTFDVMSTLPPYQVMSTKSLSSIKAPSHSPIESPTISTTQLASYCAKSAWITYDKRNVLWIPPEYRSHMFRISPCGAKIALGTQYGMIWFVLFDPSKYDPSKYDPSKHEADAFSSVPEITAQRETIGLRHRRSDISHSS